MERKDVQTKKDLYLYEIRASTIDCFIWGGIIFIIAVILAVYRLWLPLAILFFGYIVGFNSGDAANDYGDYQKLFRDQFEKKKE